MIFIPEIRLYTILNQILDLIRDDIKANASTSKDSILYQMFEDTVYGDDRSLYEDAKVLFLRKKDDPRLLEVRYFFDISRSLLPTLHITCPAENPGKTNSIGQDYTENIINHKQGIWREVFKRAFNPTYQIIITTDNPIECLIIYTVMKSMLISLFASLSFAGLQDPSISGQELQSEAIPPEVYMKAINLNVFYEMEIPAAFTHQVGKGIMFRGTPINEIYKDLITPPGVKPVD